MSEEFFSRALELATNVPARSQQELSAWQCRGLTEVALCVLVSQSGVAQLDEQVAKLDLKLAPDRFLSRLYGLRKLIGPVPSFYIEKGEWCPKPKLVSNNVLSDVRIACALADSLLQKASHASVGEETSALNGVGRAAFVSRASWRPASPNNNPVEFVEFPTLDMGLLWRAWMTTPNGLKMVVPDERLDPVKMDIWWGVHNGAHLDHLCICNDIGPSLLEFGAGLLVAEALAMSSELLLALESFFNGQFAVSAAIAHAIVERAGRLELPRTPDNGYSFGVAAREESAEFVALPTLSEAYVSGPLDLMRRCHVDPLIPTEISVAYQARWAEISRKCELAAKFTEQVLGG